MRTRKVKPDGSLMGLNNVRRCNGIVNAIRAFEPFHPKKQGIIFCLRNRVGILP